jgi:hypothetical protein
MGQVVDQVLPIQSPRQMRVQVQVQVRVQAQAQRVLQVALLRVL